MKVVLDHRHAKRFVWFAYTVGLTTLGACWSDGYGDPSNSGANLQGESGGICSRVSGLELAAPDPKALCASAHTLPLAWACDGYPDCPAGEDEGPLVDCDGLRCDDGSYVPSAWQCDGDADCKSGADERDCEASD